ncbi:MAG: hypothetical protein E6G31_01050 [Actinobacteria bacterium]|jgi:hypothetical protein|nr:MAG: hypothetical protein E6G31_01050 [Actinomycetota bacterium]
MSEREELDAHVAARRELGPEYEPELVDSFLERIEGKLDQRHRGKAARRDKEHHAITPLVLGSLGLAIPLMAIAGSTAGPFGVAMVCIAIVLVNLFVARR